MVSQNRSRRTLVLLASLVILVGLIPSPVSAQYAITNLVSNQAGKAKHQDKVLVNAWGMSFFPGGPFWISDNGTGVSTFYDGKGVKVGQVTVPPACNTVPDCVTGQVANSTKDFVVSQGGNSGPAAFIFATFEPGTISGWNPSVNASSSVVVVNANAWYTGLAIGVNNGANFLFGADNLGNKVDIYDGKFKLVGHFSDSKLTGLIVYNVQNINGKLYVTFSDSNFSKGAVDIFTTSGKLIKRLTKDAHLKAPWGVALAPKNFGSASNALLVGNVGDGRINVFNAKTGKFMSQLKGTNNKVLSISGLWSLAFGQGGGMNGKPNQLFFTAGPNGYANGLFGVINFK
ncbi:MAG TPA: TIGR03118 family protein [Terriglobales bacterium]|jgi:uncharacterized protein (TIGR03118 family)|nr:TIGR03118 family protein [Terriglobales bacterium]